MSILSACQQDAVPVAVLPTDSSLVLRNIPYGTDTAQRMDVYLPAGRSAAGTPTLFLIHGGGWNGGDKTDFAGQIAAFQKRMPGFAIVNINYRLAGGSHLFPKQEEDVRSALHFLTSQASAYAIDTGRIVLLGASAGAHLALLQAYKYASPRIAAVIDFFGPADLTVMYNRPWHPLVPLALQMVTGTTPAANPDLFRLSSPVTFIGSGTPPTLIFHGGSDPVVDVSQSRELQARLEKAGVASELIIYPRERHGWTGATLSRSFDTIEDFLRKQLP